MKIKVSHGTALYLDQHQLIYSLWRKSIPQAGFYQILLSHNLQYGLGTQGHIQLASAKWGNCCQVPLGSSFPSAKFCLLEAELGSQAPKSRKPVSGVALAETQRLQL